MIGNREGTADPSNLPGSDGVDAPTIGYVRLSQESDRSIAAQKRDIRDYCADRDLELARILNEGTGTSGFNETREKYDELQCLVREGNVSTVVVRDLSRLSRDQNDRIRLLLSLDERGVDLHSVERGLVDTSDYNLAIEAAMAASDDVGKRKEIERAKQETERRLEKGYYQGRPPYGLTFDDAGERLVPGEQFDIAVRVLELRDAGHSYREIADELDPAKSTVGRILDRREQYEKFR